MIDREKVIKGLEHCDFGASGFCYEKECPYYQSHDCTDELKNDILALLKEQEPKQVELDMYGNAYCPWCSTERTIDMGVQKLHIGTRFCPYCGQAVKWE